MKRALILLLFLSNASLITLARQPVITSFSPLSGAVGTLVTISGTNLNNSTSFAIGVTPVIIISNTDTTLTGLIMPGAITAALSVTTAGGTSISVNNFFVTQTSYPSLQQGDKLIGSGASGNARQGLAVSISADGNTSIVGGPYDNNDSGAVWVYTRSGGEWTQQGNKLVGTGFIGTAEQGYSVSLSADGNTAIVGGFNDNNAVGAAWIFNRSGGIWTQQGSKLVGTGGGRYQGNSVSISSDGNTAIVGSLGSGGAWIYTRSGGIWTQQGNKLVTTGASGLATPGFSVSLSADGNTSIIGGPYDNGNSGAAWVYTRSGGVWTQQGNKLVGTGAIGNTVYQGWSVSLSADGNTAIVGGIWDNNQAGAAWVYTRSGGVWSQQGGKLIGNDAENSPIGAEQGYSVSLSADGNTAIVGGYYDNNYSGATWVYTRAGALWTQQGSKLVGTGATTNELQGGAVSLSFDGTTAIEGGYFNNNSEGAAWVFTSCAIPFIGSVTANVNPVCASATATLTANGVSGTNALLTWWTGSGGTGTNLGNANPLTNQDTGIYYARVTGNCGSPAEASIIVTSTDTPAMPIGGAGSGTVLTQITANWDSVPGATSYFLDVSTDSAFGVGTFVSGYNSLNVGNVISQNITGLIANTTYYYRIRANNSCGVSANSNTIAYATTSGVVTGISDIAPASNILVYPNPAKNELTVETLNSTAKQILITDALSRMLIQLSSKTTKTQIDVHSLSAGVYFVKTRMCNGYVHVNKFVKE